MKRINHMPVTPGQFGVEVPNSRTLASISHGRAIRYHEGWHPLFRLGAVAVVVVVSLCAISTRASAQVYNNPAVSLPVRFLSQVPNNDWSKHPPTMNCGQACAAMLSAYYGQRVPAFADITAENKWLACRFNDPRYLDINGYKTWCTGRNEIGTLLGEYCKLKYSFQCGTDARAILCQLQQGRPCLVAVLILNGKLVASGQNAEAHWALVVGWNPKTQQLQLDDPGASSGDHEPINVADFERSWATQGRIFTPVWR